MDHRLLLIICSVDLGLLLAGFGHYISYNGAFVGILALVTRVMFLSSMCTGTMSWPDSATKRQYSTF